jgi:hypothetical protein
MVKEILEKFKESGVSQAAIERILDLRQGDLSKEETPELKALMSMLETFPWLLNVAEHKFDQTYARSLIAHIGVDTLIDIQEYIDANGKHEHGCTCENHKKNEDEGKSKL